MGLLIRFSRRPFQDAPRLAIKLINRNLRIGLDKTYSQVCNLNEWHKVNVTFFRACFSDKPHRRSNESEHTRTQTNCDCTHKVRFRRKYALFRALSHNGFCDAPFARHYCAYDGMDFHTSDNVYSCVILTRHYCIHNDMDFMSRNTRYNAGDFSVSLLHIWWHWFHGASCRVFWRAFWRLTYAL